MVNMVRKRVKITESKNVGVYREKKTNRLYNKYEVSGITSDGRPVKYVAMDCISTSDSIINPNPKMFVRL